MGFNDLKIHIDILTKISILYLLQTTGHYIVCINIVLYA